MLASLREGDIVIVARLDRLTRSLLQFAGLVERATEEGWSLVAVDQAFDLGTPAGRAMAGMCAVFAAYERDLIAERTREALRALPRDRRNGRPVYDGLVRERAVALKAEGLTLREIAKALMAEGVLPVRGGTRLYASTVSRLLAD